MRTAGRRDEQEVNGSAMFST